MVDWQKLYQNLLLENTISKTCLKKILNTALNFFKTEPNMIYLEDPINVVGDIHGQFYDLKQILLLGGSPELNKYLFLGDYVDRGIYSFEVITTLLCLKINCPNSIFMLRGNHETRMMTNNYGFYQEVLAKFDQEIYDLFMTVFDNMPIASVINGKFLCIHGGISPHVQSVKDINKINRNVEPP